jgi:hypothetical protein
MFKKRSEKWIIWLTNDLWKKRDKDDRKLDNPELFRHSKLLWVQLSHTDIGSSPVSYWPRNWFSAQVELDLQHSIYIISHLTIVMAYQLQRSRYF